MNAINLWFPALYQIKIRRNDNWLQSAFVGVTAPVLNFWQLIWFMWFDPLPKVIAYTYEHFSLRNLPGVFCIAWRDPFTRAWRVTWKTLFLIPLRGLMGDVQPINVRLEDL